LILKEKAARFNEDSEIQAILDELEDEISDAPPVHPYASSAATNLLAHTFDRAALAKRRLPYERLDQLTMEILFGSQ
jgi:xylose isomerase